MHCRDNHGGSKLWSKGSYPHTPAKCRVPKCGRRVADLRIRNIASRAREHVRRVHSRGAPHGPRSPRVRTTRNHRPRRRPHWCAGSRCTIRGGIGACTDLNPTCPWLREEEAERIQRALPHNLFARVDVITAGGAESWRSIQARFTGNRPAAQCAQRGRSRSATGGGAVDLFRPDIGLHSVPQRHGDVHLQRWQPCPLVGGGARQRARKVVARHRGELLRRRTRHAADRVRRRA